MKKLNSNNRIFEDHQQANTSNAASSHFVMHNGGSYTQRDISGGINSSVSPRGQPVHGSANQIQLASGQKLHLLVSNPQHQSNNTAAYVQLKNSGAQKANQNPHSRKGRNLVATQVADESLTRTVEVDGNNSYPYHNIGNLVQSSHNRGASEDWNTINGPAPVNQSINMQPGMKQSVDSNAVIISQGSGRVNLQQQFRKGRYRAVNGAQIEEPLSPKKPTADRQTRAANLARAPPLNISQNFKGTRANAYAIGTLQATPQHGAIQLINNQIAQTREVSPKNNARIHSLDPPHISNKKMIINTSRTLAISERDPSLDPPGMMNNKNMQLQSTYNQPIGASAQKINQLRKSRAGKDNTKNANQSQEPGINIAQNASINSITSPQNWKQQTKNGSFISSPVINNTFAAPQQSLNLSLREQLYQVKNNVSKQFQGPVVNQRNGSLQSPRLTSDKVLSPQIQDGPTSLSSKLGANSATTQASSKMAQPNQIKFPMAPSEASRLLGPYLLEIEKKEILEFDTIYYFNMQERIKNSGNASLPGGVVYGKLNETTNNGFDSDQQEYVVRYNEHIAYRYEVVKKLGKGSFGIVLRVFDHKQKEFVALKILKNKKRLYKQGLVESKLIETLNKHDPEDKKNIVKRMDHFVFRKHLCLTFELLSVNLYDFIKMNNFQGFSLSLIKRFAIQILISLYYMREHNIVHCDLKPENILLRKINKSGIKIIDFGSGCFEDQKIYTYIQSRFYRAPEIVLGIPYNSAIDMWSFGCILYELSVGYPLFPGEDEKEHMALMMEVKGVPPRSVLARATRRRVFYDDDYQPIIVPNSKGKIRTPNSKNLATLINSQDPDFVDFIDKCIEWKSDVRMTPEAAFSHPFISKAVNELKCLRTTGNQAQQVAVTNSASNAARGPQQQPLHNSQQNQNQQNKGPSNPSQPSGQNSARSNNQESSDNALPQIIR